MLQTKTLLLEIQQKISGYHFKKLVNKYNGDKGIRIFSTKNLLSLLLYFHISGKKSIRDVILSLKSKSKLWYHLGLKSISRNNLSYALKNRSHKIFEESFYMLLNKFINEKGFGSDKRFKFKNPLKAIDSSTISLSLSLFDWAKFRKAKGGIKLHTLYDIQNQIPEFVYISNAKRNDMSKCFTYPIIKNGIYTMDKGYIYFKFFQKINKIGAFFVSRTKINTKYKIIKRQKKKVSSIKADWIIKITGTPQSEYPDNLRVVRYYDKEKQTTYEYITNNFKLSAKTIANIYKARWDIELFFKSIKQHLKIKTFLGTSENAVKTQIWIALISFLLIQYIRFKTKTSYSFLSSLRLIKENILTNISLYRLLSDILKIDFSPPSKSEIQLELGF